MYLSFKALLCSLSGRALKINVNLPLGIKKVLIVVISILTRSSFAQRRCPPASSPSAHLSSSALPFKLACPGLQINQGGKPAESVSNRCTGYEYTHCSSAESSHRQATVSAPHERPPTPTRIGAGTRMPIEDPLLSQRTARSKYTDDFVLPRGLVDY
ncbi:hypothetical protein B0H19DRAFT_1066231 [Mycena capillaripes]|nr:hypothetical protein B0H19DRAFT_1066231 [Mycena capillaripes]